MLFLSNASARPLAAGLVLAVLAGCGGGADTGQGPARTAAPSACGADRFAALVGQPVIRLPGDEVEGEIRLIRPGDPVTRDLRPARLNVMLNAQDNITALTCG